MRKNQDLLLGKRKEGEDIHTVNHMCLCVKQYIPVTCRVDNHFGLQLFWSEFTKAIL